MKHRQNADSMFLLAIKSDLDRKVKYMLGTSCAGVVKKQITTWLIVNKQYHQAPRDLSKLFCSNFLASVDR